MYSVVINNVGEIYQGDSYDKAVAKYNEVKAQVDSPNSEYFGYDVFLIQDGNRVFKRGGNVGEKAKKLKSDYNEGDLVSFDVDIVPTANPSAYYFVERIKTPLSKFNKEFKYDIVDIFTGDRTMNVDELELVPSLLVLKNNLKKKRKVADKLMDINDYIMAKLRAFSGSDVYGNPPMQKEYFKELKSLLKSENIESVNPKVHDELEDQNYHLMNQALAYLGVYGKDMFKTYMRIYDDSGEYKSYYLNPYPILSEKKKKYYDMLSSVRKKLKLAKGAKSKETYAKRLQLKEKAILNALSKVDSFKHGGKLKDEFMFDKNFVIYIPSTTNVGTMVSEQEMASRINEVKSYFADMFGGFTETDADGGYKSNSGEIIQEDIVKVSVFSKTKDWKEKESEVVSKIKEWAKEWGQEAIGFEYEGDLYYVDEHSKKKSPVKMALGGDVGIKEDETSQAIWHSDNPEVRSLFGIGGKVIHR
jgi:hypothetical protein